MTQLRRDKMFNRKTMVVVIFFIMVAPIFLSVEVKAADELSPSVQVKTKTGVGKYLADSKGMTLYYFKKDSAGKSACTAKCLKTWPVFYAKELIAPSDITPSDMGMITREDGKEQVIFKGYPLYYYVKDKKPGDTSGHKTNNVWFVVNPESFNP
ncbi:MAG: hypothetical protein C4538_11925 [Nitrospiraceae bacterium]|nr:MAG: hypothetical protein C4538_11925 [Nitrospiraceae bacterium]